MGSYLVSTVCMDLQLSLVDKCRLLCGLLQSTLLTDCKDCWWCKGSHNSLKRMLGMRDTHHQKSNQLQWAQLGKDN